MTAPEGGGDQDSTQDPDEVGEIYLGESAWTFPVILGLTSASALDVTFALLLLLINLGMQIMFAYVILGPSFMGSLVAQWYPFAFFGFKIPL